MWVLTALLLVCPAAAQTPPPTVLSFDGGDLPGQYTATLTQRGAGCTGEIFQSDTGPHSQPSFLFAPCRPTLRIAFPTPKASVQLFARALTISAPALVATGHTTTGETVSVTAADPSTWRPISLAAPLTTHTLPSKRVTVLPTRRRPAARRPQRATQSS